MLENWPIFIELFKKHEVAKESKPVEQDLGTLKIFPSLTSSNHRHKRELADFGEPSNCFQECKSTIGLEA